MTSGQRERSSPSLSTLCSHPRHRSATPITVTTSSTLLECTVAGRRHDRQCAAYGPPLATPSNRPAAAAGRPTTTPPPSKLLLYEHRTRHDAPTGAGFARTAVSSMALLAAPPHIGNSAARMRTAPSLAYKRRGSPPAAGGRRTAITHALSAFTTILALASINTSGTRRSGLLSRHACSPPLRAPRCKAKQCPEHTAAERTAPAGTRINPVSLVASTGPSRGRSHTFRTDSWWAR
jgi:hypothetical protein